MFTIGEFGNERYEKEAFQIKVRDNFLKMRKESNVHWEVIDADQTLEAVEAQVQQFATKVVAESSAKPIQYL